MDKPDNVMSLINLATVRSLEEQWGYRIDPLRFRANIYIDGAAPWEEFDWVGNDIRLGEAVFRVDRRNGRCGATNVDPATGRRDLRHSGFAAQGVRAQGSGGLPGRADRCRPGGRRRAGTARRGGATRRRRRRTRRRRPAVRTFICRGCYYIYDEAQGLPLAGVPAGTRFADLPATWRCPDCGTDKTTFRPHLAAS